MTAEAMRYTVRNQSTGAVLAQTAGGKEAAKVVEAACPGWEDDTATCIRVGLVISALHVGIKPHPRDCAFLGLDVDANAPGAARRRST